MKEVEKILKEQTEWFERNAGILHYLRDTRFPPQERLRFAPYMVPWVLGFADIMKYVLRDPSTVDPIQLSINLHALEDEDHWKLYLNDLETLGMDYTMCLSEATRLWWGPGSKKSRRLVYELVALISSSGPRMRMVILKALEETSLVSFKGVSEVGEAFEAATGKKLQFFGKEHFRLEKGHTLREEESAARVEEIQLTDQERQEAHNIITMIFDSVMDMTNEFLVACFRTLPNKAGTPSSEGRAKAGRGKPAA